MVLHLFELHSPRQLNGLEAPDKSEAVYDLAWQQLDARTDQLLQVLPENTVVVLTADHAKRIARRSGRTRWGHIRRKIRENLRRPRRPEDWKSHGFHVLDELLRIPCALARPGVAWTAIGADVQGDNGLTQAEFQALSASGLPSARVLLELIVLMKRNKGRGDPNVKAIQDVQRVHVADGQTADGWTGISHVKLTFCCDKVWLGRANKGLSSPSMTFPGNLCRRCLRSCYREHLSVRSGIRGHGLGRLSGEAGPHRHRR